MLICNNCLSQLDAIPFNDVGYTRGKCDICENFRFCVDIKIPITPKPMTLQEEFQNLKDQINSLEKRLAADSMNCNEFSVSITPDPTFEVMKWYKHYSGSICAFFIAKGAFNKGFTRGKWSECIQMLDPSNWTPMTDKEVEEVLIKEAEKRGFKSGVKFESAASGSVYKVADGPLYFYDKKDKSYSNLYPSTETGCIFEASTGNWAKIIPETPSKPKIEIGKWYKWTGTEPVIGRVESQNYEYREFYSLYTPSKPGKYNYCSENWLIHATESEIKEELMKEAQKRGYKPEQNLRPLPNCSRYISKYYNIDFIYNIIDDMLQYNGTAIYLKGQWAEIIDEKITICGKEVEFHEKTITINEVVYPRTELQTLLAMMKRGQIKSLNVGCNSQETVNMEVLERILVKFNDNK